ncbi:efflux RND transporter periplasmic adaptor subunit [Methylocapsa sp. S129]|uniref:efflux RND transporter periplasmic adaptor subunit n=1 Tax=Methylocapsa sp. S129 TaxID=1641869 RepID=UPI00131A9049|nr:efflux RND transporter periplasmic adaptor subunit [Methylocapsa sp. S129]
MGFRRVAGLILVLAVALAAYGAYMPETIEKWSPAAGIYAWKLHDFLPASATGRQVSPTSVAGSPVIAAPAPSTTLVPVIVAKAVRKDLPWRVEAIGTVQPIATVTLRTRVDAAVDQVLVADGAAVKAGDILFKLDARQADAQLKGAQAQLAKDQAQLDQNKRDVVRYTDLVARSATPILNLDNARTAAATNEAAILGDLAAIDNLQVQLSWYTISAPISGRVGTVAIKAGNIARTGDNSAAGAFATINQISPIYVSFSVTQTLLPAIREAMAKGAKVVATPQGSKKGAEGKLALFENTVDPGTGTIMAHAVFENADETLWPGQLCNLQLTLRNEPDTVVAPREAIQIGQSGNYVFTIVDGAAHVQPVVAGRSQDGEIVVTQGLSGGETVVVDGALLLTEGVKVEARDPQKGAS